MNFLEHHMSLFSPSNLDVDLLVILIFATRSAQISVRFIVYSMYTELHSCVYIYNDSATARGVYLKHSTCRQTKKIVIECNATAYCSIFVF